MYDENEKLTRMETYETYEKGDLCEECDGDGEDALLEDSVTLSSEMGSSLGMAAVILSAIGLGISIARLLQDK